MAPRCWIADQELLGILGKGMLKLSFSVDLVRCSRSVGLEEIISLLRPHPDIDSSAPFTVILSLSLSLAVRLRINQINSIYVHCRSRTHFGYERLVGGDAASMLGLAPKLPPNPPGTSEQNLF